MATFIDAAGAAKEEIRAFQGCTFVMLLKFKDADGNPIDVMGSTFLLQARDSAGNVIVEMSTADGGGMTCQNTNELSFDVPAEDMDVAPGRYPYDLIETTYEEETLPCMYGDFLIQKKQSTPQS